MRPVAAVLFDLDGTLLDTAPDLVFALNAALEEAGLPVCPEDEVKPFISGGARAMLGYWFAKKVEEKPFFNSPHPTPLPKGEGTEDLFELLLERMLDLYEAHVADRTRFFDGMETVLEELESRSLPWGIVTNKVSRFTDPLADALNLAGRSGCIVSGDTTAEKKPHPLPLLEASRRLGREPGRCVYIGDAAKDMEAGRRAGMATLAALYGYIAANDEPVGWGADGFLAEPRELLDWLDGRPRP
jgi:2-phosphoglycolate phosphatase